MTKVEKTAHGFLHADSSLEEYFVRRIAPTGAGMKNHERQAARSAACEFERTVKAKRHRDHYYGLLTAAGVNETFARTLAYEVAEA